MDQSSITVRYSKAIFSLAKEKNQLSALKSDMEIIASVCAQSSDFNLLLNSSIIPTSEKIRMIKLIFKNKISELSLNFLELVTRNKREVFLASFCRYLLTLIRKEKNIKTAVMTTALEMDNKVILKAEKIIEKELGGQVELTGKVDKQIIGGLVIRIDDKQYDASIATQLKKLKQQLMNPDEALQFIKNN